MNIIEYKKIQIQIKHINVNSWVSKTVNYPSGTLMASADTREKVIDKIKSMIDSFE